MPDDSIYPMSFEPVFRDYIWGGRHLATHFGRALPPGIVAESWEISGHPSSPTQVDRGQLKGQTLPQVLTTLGAELVGTRAQSMLERGKFPLLVKLLDANQPLSVQVHPDDAFAQENEGGELGKTEMWYVLWAEPGAELIYGLQPGVTPQSFRQAIERNSLEDQLHREPIQADDCIFVPAGTVHALLAGAVVAEIQQNSDTTYRVYDWGRLGVDGQPRPLHVGKALAVIDWGQVTPHKVVPEPLPAPDGVRRELLVRCEQFLTERVTLNEGATYAGHCDGSTLEIWGCLAGAGLVQWQGAPLNVEAVRFVLLPAALGAFRVASQVRSTWLRTTIP